MISRLEHQKVEWEREFCCLRCTLKQEEEEERRNADTLYEKIREKLRRKEDEYKKEVETKQVELALRTLNMELKAAKNQVVARQLQQELADTLKKQSMSEASPEVASHLRLEDETRDLKKKLGQIRSQLQEAQERHAEAAKG
ncbi:ankyrin repeat domain-containing protein 26-like isoform X4 [Panthera uncia]|uniref:ankyrin repeat domain-containing protein 26-like isoform X4 n=1 Tax=Panthera uncia TaxID=29064 RepID=UPI0020FFC63C|nr:ankyrin repeat domain-containing protein 26-like isoform X4 [Panthera uncia]